MTDINGVTETNSFVPNPPLIAGALNVVQTTKIWEMVPGMGFEPMTFGFPWKRSI